MEEYSQEIIDNIKHEPEVHFTLFLPDDPETDDEPEVKKVKIVLRKFDKTWKSSPELFKSYFACGKCGYANKKLYQFNNHLKVCETLKKCDSCHQKAKSENIIKCGLCYQQFKCKNCKANHISQVHCKGSTWICSGCDYKTLNRECLRNHYQIHVKKFSCQTCKQNFAVKHRLIIHQQQHRHGDYATKPGIKFDCKFCVSSFATKIGLRRHEMRVHCKLRFHCDVCGKKLKTIRHIQNHMQTHFKVPCPICHRLLAENCLQRHIDKHTTTASFKCNACDSVYFNRIDLNRHKRRKHEIKQVQCDLCQKIFNNKQLLRVHMINHLMVSCSTCNVSMCKKYLNKHMKIHSSRRESLACPILNCKQKYKNFTELKEHKKIHFGPKIYKCPNCNHQSTRLQIIKSHMKCHLA